MRSRPVAAVLASVALVTAFGACSGLKEALTAHVDVAARAASQELSVTRLSELLGNARVPVPVSRENAGIIADLWVNYQLLGHAAAVGDSLADHKAIDEAVSSITKNVRLRKFTDTLVKSFKTDSGSEATYNQAAGDLYAARHILFAFPDKATPAQKDSVRRRADAIRPTVTNANFSQLAERYSSDPSAKGRGGSLGVYPKGQMVPAFSNAVAALQPGQIGPSLVETNYGFHIVQRLAYGDVRDEYAKAYPQVSLERADSAYLAELEKNAKIEVKQTAPALAKTAVGDPVKYRRDKATLATFKGGDLTVAEFLGWVESMPPQMQVSRQLPQLPDSVVKTFITSVAQREVMLQKADSAKIDLSTEERTQIYAQFAQLVSQLEMQLGIDPRSLSDSARSSAERERVAASRIDAYIDRILGGEAQPVPIPPPLASVLQSRYESSVNAAGIDRAVERAKKLRDTADSTRAANQPRSQIPLPGMPGAGAPPDTSGRTAPPARTP